MSSNGEEDNSVFKSHIQSGWKLLDANCRSRSLISFIDVPAPTRSISKIWPKPGTPT